MTVHVFLPDEPEEIEPGKINLIQKDGMWVVPDRVEKVMLTIHPASRKRWCGGEDGACYCMGCVQVSNRRIMWEEMTGKKFFGDPEHIDEREIPREIYNKYKISKQDWEIWMFKQNESKQLSTKQ